MPAPGGRSCRVTRAVQALYEQYPYPAYRHLYVCPDLAGSLAYVAGRCWQAPLFRPRRILVAGCGTSEVVSLAAGNPSAAVLGLDLSAASLRIAGRMARDLGLRNLELRQADLLQLSGYDGAFDLISCYGVLHHTADPLRGLRRLARALAPGGLLSLMVYSQRVRHEIGEIQRAFALLNGVRERRGGDSSPGARLALARRLVAALAASGSRLAAAARAAVGLAEHDPTQFADAYIQPREVRYTLDEVLALVREAGLALANFAREGEWDPGAYLDDPALVARLRALPRAERWRFCDLAGSPFYHVVCTHPGAPVPPRPCLQDDALALALVPRPCAVHSYPLRHGRVAGPRLPEPREGRTFTRGPGGRVRFRGSLGELDSPAVALEYVRLADGRRTAWEIADLAARQAGLPAAPPAEVAAVFRSLFGMTTLLAPDAGQCRGCPLRREARS